MPPKRNEETDARVLAFRDEHPGWSGRKLARELGMPYMTVWNALNRDAEHIPDRWPHEQQRIDEVKAAVRAGTSYAVLARRFDWPG